MKTTWRHFLRLVDLMFGILFGVWSVHVFLGILSRRGYQCYNEPNKPLARFEFTCAIVVLVYALGRLFSYIKGMWKGGK